MTHENGIEQTEDGILVTFTGRFDTVEGWKPVREDLGLNKGGPEPVEGVEIVEEDPLYHDPDDDYPYGYERVVLRFDDSNALENASDRLYSKATERFEWGMHKEAERVQTFAGRIPSRHDVPGEIDA